jgi:hypothetical protein
MRKAKGCTTSGMGRPDRGSGKFRTSFVLMELLIVIAVIALLMAILLPTLHRIRRQARAVACQANLHQWGLMFSMYTGSNDGKFFTLVGGDTWIEPMRSYYGNCEDSLFLCPMAKKPYVEQPEPLPADPALDTVTKKRFWALKYIGGGTKYHAWWLFEPTLFCSYGLNDWVMDHPVGPINMDSLWRSSDVKDSSNVPVFLDCVWRGSRPHYLDPPPADENYPPRIPLGADMQYSAMQYFCIDRHDASINSLFMDWSVRKTGLKQLWALRWHRYYDPNGPWTKAGGVEPSDWPEWMRNFKDY